MPSVNVSLLTSIFSKYDTDKNNKLDRAEVAKASLNLMGQDDEQSQVTGQLMATFVQGGKDKSGLFPDFDGDQAISKAELGKLAAAGGNANTLEKADFTAAFPDNISGEGSEISVDGLTEIAKGNISKFDNTKTDGQSFVNALGSTLPEGFQSLLSQMMTLFQSFGGLLKNRQ